MQEDAVGEFSHGNMDPASRVLCMLVAPKRGGVLGQQAGPRTTAASIQSSSTDSLSRSGKPRCAGDSTTPAARRRGHVCAWMECERLLWESSD